MSKLLKEWEEAAAKAFDGLHGALLRPPSPTWERRLKELEEQGNYAPLDAALLDMRCEQVENLGLVRVESEQLVPAVMGESYTDSKWREDLGKRVHDWTFDHHRGRETDLPWQGAQHDFWREIKRRAWYLPPFSKQEVWRCRWGKLPDFKAPVHYKALGRMKQARQLGVFNGCSVLAPMPAWEKEDCGPYKGVILAQVWELPRDNKGVPQKCGRARSYVLAACTEEDWK